MTLAVDRTQGREMNTILPSIAPVMLAISFASFAGEPPSEKEYPTLVLRCVLDYDKKANKPVEHEVFLKWENGHLNYWEQGMWTWSGSTTTYSMTPTMIQEQRETEVNGKSHSYYRRIDRTTGNYHEEAWRGTYLAKELSGTCAPSGEPPTPRTKF